MQKNIGKHKLNSGRTVPRNAVWFAIAATFAPAAYAFDIDTGNADLSIRWDNSIRYNYQQRIDGRDRRIELANPRSVSTTLSPNGYVFDGGNNLVDKNSTISNRLDVLSEFDINYQGRLGARVSAALWYDDGFPSRPKYAAENFTSTTGHGYANDEWSSYVKRYYAGPSGEFLDAYVFSNFNIMETAGNVKLGRHAVIWGEGLIGSTHSIAYSQSPSDGMKAATNPGASAKETALPVNQLSFIAQFDPTLTLLGQYQFEWRSSRYPEGSTYFSGSNYSIAQGATLNRANPSEGESGNWGLGLKWSPEWLDGTLGLYYREFDDFNPWAAQAAPVLGVNLNISRAVYLKDVSLWGLTLSKNIAGVSVGAELSHRHNAALSSSKTASAPGTNEGAIGDTWHAVLNGVASYSKGPWGLWDTSSLAGELAWSKLDKVNKNANLFSGVNNLAACPVATAAIRSCYDSDYLAASLTFTPAWQQVWPSVDLSMPLLISSSFQGNGPTNGGGSEGFATYRVGLGATVYSKHQIDLAYTWYKQNIDQASGRVQGPVYSDKGYLALTYRATF